MKEAILEEAEAWVQSQLYGEASGHDWWHICRVVQTARKLATEEGADPFICELSALLHDIADEKLAGSKEAGEARVKQWLEAQEMEAGDRAHVMEIISTMSFSAGTSEMATLEGKVVQDADRLDALGAVGIARTFAYSGFKGQAIYDPELPPRETMTKEQYRKEKSTAVNHFHEKLLKLAARMNTATGRRMAEARHRVMEAYLEQFHAEWNGDR